MTVELTGEAEKAVRQAAATLGRSPQALVSDAVESYYSVTKSSNGASKSDQLLRRLNQGLPLGVWERFKVLKARTHHGDADSSERAEFSELNDQVELWHAERLRLAGELSKELGLSFDQTLDRFQIRPDAGV